MVQTKLKFMKNLLFVIAGLLIVIWLIAIVGFKPTGIVHMLLVLAGLLILIRLVFGKQLSRK
jgi:Flp pilus assembly protein TadB